MQRSQYIFLRTSDPSNLSKCCRNKMGFGKEVALVGFCLWPRRRTGRGELSAVLRMPSQRLKSLIIQYLNIFGYFVSQNIKLKWLFSSPLILS